ncbi:MAG: DUF2917 domain-containing protein [Rhodocyclaceae bacterium]
MVANVQETRRELARRELLALDRARGCLLTCESGELWITRDGSADDLILGAGESWRVEGNGELVVSALRPALLVIAHPPAAAPRIAPHGRAASVLALLRRWQHPPLASYPATLLR